ncbi:MAG TPA: hypothetical protein VGR51_03285 [Thermoplasmata archaeon]|jgi:hypothetical protein|nr:hypothetical protein [Thermoplasmata archaeon]
MRVEVAREVGKTDLTREIETLEGRHEGFDALRQRVFVERCNDPVGVDDYVVWKALREEAVLEERTVFDTPDVFRALTPRRIELLEYLHGNRVPSIKELAAKVRRDYKNTYDDLVALEQWGLVSLRREGKNQRPVTLVTSLRVSWEK